MLGALSPPRVASEEGATAATRPAAGAARAEDGRGAAAVWRTYTDGASLAGAIATGGGGAFVVRPAPEDEQTLAVEAVRRVRCGSGGARW